MILDAGMVVIVHDFILSREPGLVGTANRGILEGALGRIENRIHYGGLVDVFEISGLYAEAIARDMPSLMPTSERHSFLR